MSLRRRRGWADSEPVPPVDPALNRVFRVYYFLGAAILPPLSLRIDTTLPATTVPIDRNRR